MTQNFILSSNKAGCSDIITDTPHQKQLT